MHTYIYNYINTFINISSFLLIPYPCIYIYIIYYYLLLSIVITAFTALVIEQTPLTAKLSSSFVKEKTTLYLGTYLLLFVGLTSILVVCRILYLLSIKLGIPIGGKGRNTFAESMASSSIWEPYDAPPPDHNTRSKMLLRLDKDNQLRRDIYKHVEEAALMKSGLLHSFSTNESSIKDPSLALTLSKAVRESFLEAENAGMLPREVYEYLYMKYTVLDVEATLFPHGLLDGALPAGLIEDFLLYLMNNHKLFSCIFAARGSPVGGLENIQLLVLRAALEFSVTAMAAPIIKSRIFFLPRQMRAPLITSFNVLLVSPFATAVAHIASKMTR